MPKVNGLVIKLPKGRWQLFSNYVANGVEFGEPVPYFEHSNYTPLLCIISGQAGQSTVVRTSGFAVKENAGLDYRDSMQTTVEKEDRVVLRDLQEQIEGEAHFIFSGQVVRGDMFYANPSLKQAQLRVPQLLQLGQEVSHDKAA